MDNPLVGLALLQVVLPTALIVLHAIVPTTSLLALFLRMAAIALLLLYAALAGLWLFPPWWTPYALAMLLLLASARLWQRLRRAGRSNPVLRSGEATLSAVGLVAAAVLVWPAIAGQRAPQIALDLATPLGPGRYLVVNGGADAVLNAHYFTLNRDSAADFRGQSFAVDIIGIDMRGLRAEGVLPANPESYAIYGRAVLAPCSGRVLATLDGIPDNMVPIMNRDAMTGNSVILECDGLAVVLAHFIPGSLLVGEDEVVQTGQQIARVGNSGNSGEPHLHVHVQTVSSPANPLAGTPLFFTIDGRFPTRNMRLDLSGP